MQSTQYIGWIREILQSQPDVIEKKMFGSVGFIVHGKLCIGVGEHADHSILVRVGPTQYAAALQQPGASPAVMRNHEMRGYIFLTNQITYTQETVRYWVDLALHYNQEITATT